MVIRDLKKEISKILSLRDTELLITEALSISATDYVLSNMDISESDVKRISDMAERISRGEPLQYVTGITEFMSLKFNVRPGVLIPRPDTETLVEKAISMLKNKKTPAILDIGTGSGCVGISISRYVDGSEVTLLDISDTALQIAKENSKENNADVKFLKCDILSEIPVGTYDLIVSNPPYIKPDVIETLDINVRDHEPRLALDGGSDGLMFYRRIANIADKILKKDGMIAFEVGHDQADDVSAILKENRFSEIEKIKDLCGIERVVSGTKNEE